MLSSLIALLLVTTQPEPPQEAPETTEAENPDEELVCRRRLVPSERVGERFRSHRVCKTRAEWDEDSNRSRRR